MAACAPSIHGELRAGERVELRESYSLYLPHAYQRSRTWPVVFGFSPDGRGADVTERLQAAADEYGYIVIASNTARNGPWEPIYAAQDAMWKDVHADLSVDDTHLYALGFSGGARAAVAMAQRYALRGVIACGAFSVVVPGLKDSKEEKTQAETILKRLPPLVYLAFGDLDSNAWEMHGADVLMNEHGIAHWSEEFVGPHAWPGRDILSEALEFMELDRRMPHDDSAISAQAASFATSLASARIDSARALDAHGAPHLALHKLSQTAQLFPSSGASVVAEPLLFYAAAWEADGAAMDALDVSVDAGLLEDTWLTAETIAKDKGNPLQRRAIFIVQTVPGRALLRAIAHQQRGEHATAEVLLAFAAARVEHASDKPGTLYNLACAYAQLGHRYEAVAALERAIDAGFHERRMLTQDADLAPVREDPDVAPQFQKLVKRL